MLNEAINNAVETYKSALKYNLSNVFGGLLYSLKLEMEKEGQVCIINNLVNIIVETSECVDEGAIELSPVYDKNQAAHYIKVLKAALEKHGIKSHNGLTT